MNATDCLMFFNVMTTVASVGHEWSVGAYTFAIVPEILQLVVLGIIIIGMFEAIEIGHPVFCCLFLNMVVAFVITFINFGLIFGFNFRNWSKWSSNNNMAYILFHNCSWAVLSILRYFYIVKKDWLLQKLSERQLIVMSMSFIITLFSISCACFIAIFAYINFNFSSPEKNPVSELSDDVKIKAITYYLSLFWTPIILSCFVYLFLIISLRRKSLIIQAEKFSEISLEEPDDMFGVPEISELEDSINFKAREKMDRERQAVIRAITTNFTFVICFILPSLIILIRSSEVKFAVLLTLSAYKTFLPLFVTVVNFGTIREVAVKYWQSLSG